MANELPFRTFLAARRPVDVMHCYKGFRSRVAVEVHYVHDEACDLVVCNLKRDGIVAERLTVEIVGIGLNPVVVVLPLRGVPLQGDVSALRKSGLLDNADFLEVRVEHNLLDEGWVEDFDYEINLARYSEEVIVTGIRADKL